MLRSLLFSTAALALAAQTPAPDALKPAPAAAAKPVAEAKPSAVAVPAKPKEDKILARIGTEIVRESDFELFQNLTLNDQQRLKLQFGPGAREHYLNRFLEFKVLAAKARKEGFQREPDHARKLALMDMQLLIQSLMDRDGPALQAKLDLKDEEVKAFFEKHPDKFGTAETFSARHILVAVKAKGAEKGLTEEEAKAKAVKIKAELAAGKTFEAAAKEYSDDPGSKDKGGLYENASFGRFVPEFEAAVRTQALGKVGDPVKSTYGYHLILVEKVNPATFETAKAAAREQATAERQEQVMKTYLDAVKKEMSFEAGAEVKAEAPKSAPKSKKVAK